MRLFSLLAIAIGSGCLEASTAQKAALKMDKYIKTCAWAGGPPLDPKHPTYKPPQIAVLDCGHGFIGNIVFGSWGDAGRPAAFTLPAH